MCSTVNKAAAAVETLDAAQEEVMKQIDVIAGDIVVVGALNWGLIAIARFDLVATLFGMQFGEISAAGAVVYGLVGLAGLYQAVSRKRILGYWGTTRGDLDWVVDQA